MKDGRIAAIGKLAGEATTTLEVKGLIVAPGFIDVHTHAEDIEDLPLAENFLRMGVTTLVLGNCGGSKLNVAEFFKKLKANLANDDPTQQDRGDDRRRSDESAEVDQ